ncbi:unnamed protein product, partial [marine sediment metagenome]
NKELKKQLAAESRVVVGLEKEVERLKVGGIAAVRAVKKAVAAETAARHSEDHVPSAAAPAASAEDELRQERENRIAEITKELSPLELRKTNLRARIGAGQAEVSSLARATLDTRMIPPPGGFIRDGYVYGRRLTCGRREIVRSPNAWEVHRHTDSCYTSYRIGSAVRQGDFRTQHEKSMAIEAAKRGLLPLFEEMRPLDGKLTELKAELGELRRAKIEEGRRLAVVVLKHKETGETIQRILTQQKIDNLTVFKLVDGETKRISLDDWESIEHSEKGG